MEPVVARLMEKDKKIEDLKFVARQNVDQLIIVNGEQATLDDRKTGYGYVRYLADQDYFYEEVVEEKRFRSDTRGSMAVRCPLRLVLCHKYENQDGYEWFIIDALRLIDLQAAPSPLKDARIKILSSSKDKERIFAEETGHEEDNTSNTVINLLSVDFEVTWNLQPCNDAIFNPNEC